MAADATGTGAGSGTGTDSEEEEPEPGDAAVHRDILRLAVLAVFLGYSFVQTVRRALGDPWDLAFVVGAYVALATLLWFMHRAERLTPESPAGERRRLQVSVWALSAALSCAFAYRVSRVMPTALAVVIWCLTAAVVLVGFYFLVFSGDGRAHQYAGLEHSDVAVAGHGKSLAKKMSCEEMV